MAHSLIGLDPSPPPPNTATIICSGRSTAHHKRTRSTVVFEPSESRQKGPRSCRGDVGEEVSDASTERMPWKNMDRDVGLAEAGR